MVVLVVMRGGEGVGHRTSSDKASPFSSLLLPGPIAPPIPAPAYSADSPLLVAAIIVILLVSLARAVMGDKWLRGGQGGATTSAVESTATGGGFGSI